MYHSHFGLDEQAFSIAVNPRYLFMSSQHKEALAHLLYGVRSGGFVMLSGEVGTGKTTLIRCLLEQLPETADVAFVMNPAANAPDLLCSICDEFGVRYEPNEKNLKLLTDKLTQFLVKNHEKQRKSIVMIDEAQLLRVSTLEQVRLLTNLETNTEKLLQIILVGQPELNELLAKPSLRQLSQRITARYHLRPLVETETDAYIKHRLNVGGLPESRNPFPPKIVAKIHRISRGIPRLVNVLCDRMLLGVYSRGVTEVDSSICNQAMVEVLGGDVPKPSIAQVNPVLYVGLALSFLLVLVLLWFVVSPADQSRETGALPTDKALKSTNTLTPLSDNPVAEASPSAQKNEYWSYQRSETLDGLLKVLGLSYIGLEPCRAIEKQQYYCENKSVSHWDAFLEYQRPAMLTITTPAKRLAYVVLVGIEESDAWVQLSSGTLQKIALSDLGARWTGAFVFIWYKPESFDGAVSQGDRGRVVSWIARQFAQLDQQPNPVSNELFTGALKKRVQIFQRRHGLKDDGVVGQQTLMALNLALGLDKSLDDLAPALKGGL